MSPTEQATATARLLAAWASGERLEQNTAHDRWDEYTKAEMPRIHNPQKWRVKRHPRTFWSIPHYGHEFITTTDAATAKHWHEDGHSVIVSTEIIPQ